MSTPAVTLQYNKLLDIIGAAMMGLVERGDGSAKLFKPVPPQTVGRLESEMALLRYCVGAWSRLEDPYKTASVNLPQYLAFAYCSERALLADGKPELAAVFAFIRSMKDPKRVVAGYPSKGGLSRILEWHRRGAEVSTVCCTEEMLRMEHAIDAMAFARSEMFPVGAWNDGWTAMNKVIHDARPMNAAHRIDSVKLKQVAGGLLGAGRSFGRAKAPGIVLEGADMRKAFLYESVLKEANLAGSNLSGAMIYGADLYRANLMDAKLKGADLAKIQAPMVNLDMADLASTNLRFANFHSASFRGASFVGARMLSADLRGSNLEGANFDGANLVGTDFTGAFRLSADSPIDGWTLVNGRLMRNE